MNIYNNQKILGMNLGELSIFILNILNKKNEWLK